MKPTEPTAAPDLLTQATLALLARVPARWAALDRDALSVIEAKALEALLQRGLVEVRANGRVVLAEGGQSSRIQFEFSGVGGQRQVLVQICQELTNRGQEGRAFSVALDGDLEWRLHADGQQAQADLAGDDPGLHRYARDFATRARPSLAMGGGGLNAFAPDEVPTVPMTTPVPVNINNPEAIAAALLSALGKPVAPVVPAQPAPDAAAAPKAKGGRPARVREAVDKYLDSHKELLLPDRLGRPPRLEDWADLIAGDIERFQRQKVSPHTVRDQLKGRWSFANVRRLGAQWSVKPERQA
jgi:hypothetical protein